MKLSSSFTQGIVIILCWLRLLPSWRSDLVNTSGSVASGGGQEKKKRTKHTFSYKEFNPKNTRRFLWVGVPTRGHFLSGEQTTGSFRWVEAEQLSCKHGWMRQRKEANALPVFHALTLQSLLPVSPGQLQGPPAITHQRSEERSRIAYGWATSNVSMTFSWWQPGQLIHQLTISWSADHSISSEAAIASLC